MTFAQKHKQELINLYVNEKKSTYQIAQELGTNAKRISRALKSLGVELRSYSQAQTQSLKNGRSKHPTKGKKMSDSTKAKLSRAVSKYWDQMSEEEKVRRSNVSKERWDKMSKQEQQELFSKAAQACRAAAKEGSKMEKFFHENLASAGYNVLLHSELVLKDTQLEPDLHLPELNVIIEIDGISHFEPIWGEETLARQKKSDLKKEGLILKNGFVMIRIKQYAKRVSIHKMNEALSKTTEALEKISKKFPEKQDRYIEIEVH